MQGHRDGHVMSSNTIRVLDIMLTTTREPIYRKARSFALQSIRALLENPTDDETKDCIDYETSLWVDGLSQQSIDEFCSMFQSIAKNSFQHVIQVAQSWKKSSLPAALPPISFSPLLTITLTSLQGKSDCFAILACQVAAKCLLFHRHPLPLAALIAHGLAGDERPELASSKAAVSADLLRRYSRSLIEFNKSSAKDRHSVLNLLIESLFSKDCLHSVLFTNARNGERMNLSLLNCSGKDDITVARLCLHVLSSAHTATDYEYAKHSTTVLRSLIPLVVQVCEKAFVRRSYILLCVN